MKTNAITISTCICTMSRPIDLRKTLDALELCKPAPASILVSDDSPIDDRRTEELCKEYPGVTYCPGPRKGLAANRNEVIRHVSDGWLHYIDDDVIVPSDYYQHATGYIEGSDTDQLHIYTGWELNFKQPSSPIRIEPHNVDFWGLQSVKATSPNARLASIVINSTIFPRPLFDIIGFDEVMRFGCEEIDVARHAIVVGAQIEFCEGLWVKHYPSPQNREAYKPRSITSKVYATAKGHFFYGDGGGVKRFVVTVAYLLTGPAKIAYNNARRYGVKNSRADSALMGVCEFAKLCLFSKRRELGRE